MESLSKSKPFLHKNAAAGREGRTAAFFCLENIVLILFSVEQGNAFFQQSGNSEGLFFRDSAFPVGKEIQHCIDQVFKDMGGRGEADGSIFASRSDCKGHIQGICDLSHISVGEFIILSEYYIAYFDMYDSALCVSGDNCEIMLISNETFTTIDSNENLITLNTEVMIPFIFSDEIESNSCKIIINYQDTDFIIYIVFADCDLNL